MAEYSNAQKLAAVLSEWARPAISQIASSKLMQLPMAQSLQAAILGSGIVGNGYSLQADIAPMITPVVNALITPMLTRYISGVPDEAIPQMARSIVEQAMSQSTFTILDGLVTFDEEDIMELDDLLKKNLPVGDTSGYQVIH